MQVSIVLPCYNAERHLERCLTSLFVQTHRPLELIAVDDGSSDGTVAMLESATRRAPFPMQVLRQANAGACAARNAGMRAARGTYIQFMDADDEILPDKIEQHLAIAHAHGDCDLVVGSARIVKPNGELDKMDIVEPGSRDPWLDLAMHRMGGTPNNFWKRDAVLRAGAWDEGLRSSQEYDLMLRMLITGARICHDPVPRTVVHLQAGGSVSTSDPAAKWQRYIDLRLRIIAHLRATRNLDELAPFHQVLFDCIRMLHPFAPKEAVALYHAHLPKGFTPAISSATGPLYLKLHKLLGFAAANRVRSWLSALR
ncbi:MAG TPA: glycosyltransferase family A protein [Flavobacteriales bacterium]|nr:glycosyltransferase family A protein [Flavobacteriales bacterium]